MLLTLREAATLLDCPPRTLRARLTRGDIPARKVGGQWRIRRADLPMTPAQRRATQDKLAELRAAVEAAVPASVRARIGAGTLAELDVFALGRAVLVELEGADGTTDGTTNGIPDGMSDEATHGTSDAGRCLRAGLVALAEGHFQFDRDVKLAALTAARAHLARAVACLALDGACSPDIATQRAAWAHRLEGDVLPRLAGLIRWAEALPSGPRATRAVAAA